jgi:hypothetical protein
MPWEKEDLVQFSSQQVDLVNNMEEGVAKDIGVLMRDRGIHLVLACNQSHEEFAQSMPHGVSGESFCFRGPTISKSIPFRSDLFCWNKDTSGSSSNSPARAFFRKPIRSRPVQQ